MTDATTTTATTTASGLLTPRQMERIRDYVPFIAIALVILLFWAISGDRFMSLRNWTFIAQQTPVLMLLAFAQLIVVTTGSIDISIGSSLAFSAFMGALGMLWFGDAGLVLGVAAGALVGTINGLVISLLKIPSFVTTLAMLIIVRAVVIIISDGTSIYLTDGSVSGGTNISSVTAPWLLSMGKFPAIFIVAAVVAVFMWIFYEKTLFGQQLKAVGGNEKVLRLVGIDVTTFKIKVFAAAGVMVGIASCVNRRRRPGRYAIDRWLRQCRQDDHWRVDADGGAKRADNSGCSAVLEPGRPWRVADRGGRNLAQSQQGRRREIGAGSRRPSVATATAPERPRVRNALTFRSLHQYFNFWYMWQSAP